MNGQKIDGASAWSSVLTMQQNTVVAVQPSTTNPKDVTWASLFRANTEVSGELDGKGGAVESAVAVPTVLSGRLDKYKIKNCIGAGASGKVYAGEVACQSGRLASVALKVISRDGLTEGSKSLILSELKVIKALTESKFQHAIHLKEAFHDAHNCYLVTDLARLGSLSDNMKRSTFDMDKVRFTMAVLIQAIDGLHKRGIIHRDIKPENILFGEDGYPLIGDFGIAQQLSLGMVQPEAKTVEFLSKVQDDELTIGSCGTHGYMAPEILRGKAYSYGVDVFSLGVVFYQMLHRGQLPFTGGSLQDRIDAQVCSAHHVDDEDRAKQPEAFDLLEKLLEKSPANRIDVEAAKRHPYFENIDWELVEKKEYKFSFGWYFSLQHSPSIGRSNTTIQKSTLVGDCVSASPFDPELHRYGVRTLPIEPREWGYWMHTMDSDIRWPKIGQTPVSHISLGPTEDREPSNIKPSTNGELDLSGTISSQLLESIPEEEEDEDCLDDDNSCIQTWAGSWKSTYVDRLGSSSSLSGLGGGDDDDVDDVEDEMEVDTDREVGMEEDSVDSVDEEGEEGDDQINEDDEEDCDGTDEEDEQMVEALIGGLDISGAADAEKENEPEETEWVLEWMGNWDTVNRSRLGKNMLVSTERDPIDGLEAGHLGFDEDGNRITFTLHAPKQDRDTVSIGAQPWNTDGLATLIGLGSILKRKRSTGSLKPKKRVRYALPDEPEVELRSILKRKRSTSSLKSTKRVRYARPDEEFAQAGALSVSDSSTMLVSESEESISWITSAAFPPFETAAEDYTSWESSATLQVRERGPFKLLANLETSWTDAPTSPSDMANFDSFSF